MASQQPILPRANDEFEASAQLLLSIARQFDDNSSIERSLKWNKNGINWHRFLVGIDAGSMDESHLSELFRLMEMPSEIQKDAKRQPFPSTFLLGMDSGKDNLINKLYYEYWDKVVERVTAEPNNRSPILLNLGFKWQVECPQKAATTYYHCYPLLNIHEILSRIGNVLAADELANQICNLITIAARRVAKPSFVYMEASEDNGRLSFDLNLYQAELPLATFLSHFQPSRTELAAQSDDDETLFIQYQSAIVGHISAGTDQNGETFLTLYYES